MNWLLSNWPLAIPGLPMVAFVVMVALPRAVKNRILWVPIGAIIGSTLLSWAAFARVWPGGSELTSAHWNYSWVLGTVAGRPLELGQQLDAVGAILLVTVTFVATCVQIYSLGYMQTTSESAGTTRCSRCSRRPC